MQPETKVIQSIRQYVEEHGGKCYKLTGNNYSTRGLPDLLVLLNGKTMLVEVKVKGEKPDPHQVARMEEITRHSGICFWADSLDSFISQLPKNNEP